MEHTLNRFAVAGLTQCRIIVYRMIGTIEAKQLLNTVLTELNLLSYDNPAADDWARRTVRAVLVLCDDAIERGHRDFVWELYTDCWQQLQLAYSGEAVGFMDLAVYLADIFEAMKGGDDPRGEYYTRHREEIEQDLQTQP